MTSGRLPFAKQEASPSGAIVAIEGVVDRVTFSNPENGWSVLRVETDGAKSLTTVTGTFTGVAAGERLRMSGQWVTDPKYGKQFRAESFIPVAPSTLPGIQKYLGSGMIPGMGPVMAARLVERFGLETLEVLDNASHRLSEVEGIGPKRLDALIAAWGEQRAIKDVMLFLQTHGVSPTFAAKIYKHYGDRSIKVVRDDPYRLAIDMYGVGFKTADALATNLGIAKDSPRRAEAGILHLLGELSAKGHVFYPQTRLIQEAVELLEVDPVLVENAISALCSARHVVLEEVLDPTGETPEAEIGVFLTPLHRAEVELAAHLGTIAKHPRPAEKHVDVGAALDWFEKRELITLAENQRQAVHVALASAVTVVTGGPGTGKTTLIKAVTQIMSAKKREIILCAPTGRAAKRLSEATGLGARTIHRLLEFSPTEGGFQRNEGNPLTVDLLVVDEMSMVDTQLMCNLVKAIPTGAQVVLVGDVDQLPSVGPGSVLRDIIASKCVEVVRLDQIFRQASSSRIVVNAHRVNQGLFPEIDSDPMSDFHWLEREDPETVLSTIVSLVTERIPQRFGLKPIEDIQVLAPMHKGALGASRLNEVLQQTLNPRGRSLVRGQRVLRVGDKVMQIRNNYDLDVFNGDLGRIASIDDEERKLVVRYDRDVTYDFSELDDLVIAYACSIHKSQGSEYPCVVIPVHTQHYVMLQRNLIYTAITRGKKLVVLVGNKRALAMAVKNAQLATRYTQLTRRMADAPRPLGR